MEANKTFEIPQLQKMFTKEQLTQKLLEFGLLNKISLKETINFINNI